MTLCSTTSAAWAAWLAAALSVIWFVTYGIGTTRQLIHERPSITPWTKVTRGFSYGVWAAAGWPAAYLLWDLWCHHWRDHPDQINAGLFLGLLVFALMSVTGWLPDRLEALFGRKPN
jgi:uncharacterized membrane protein